MPLGTSVNQHNYKLHRYYDTEPLERQWHLTQMLPGCLKFKKKKKKIIKNKQQKKSFQKTFNSIKKKEKKEWTKTVHRQKNKQKTWHWLFLKQVIIDNIYIFSNPKILNHLNNKSVCSGTCIYQFNRSLATYRGPCIS